MTGVQGFAREGIIESGAAIYGADAARQSCGTEQISDQHHKHSAAIS